MLFTVMDIIRYLRVFGPYSYGRDHIHILVLSDNTSVVGPNEYILILVINRL